MGMIIRLVLAALCALLIAGTAQAQPGRAEYEEATKYYEAGDYDSALPLFQKAYELSGKRPRTIRALAQCERELEKFEDSIRHYREYLATNPPDAASVERIITVLLEQDAKKKAERAAALEKKLEEARRSADEELATRKQREAELEAAKAAAARAELRIKQELTPKVVVDPPPPPPPPPPEDGAPLWPALSGATVTVAALIAGVGFGVSAIDAAEDRASTTDPQVYRLADREANASSADANVAYATAGVAGAITAGLFLWYYLTN